MSTVTYLPTDDEAAEGIGPWTVETPDRPDALPVPLEVPGVLAAFEQDRYARLRAAGGIYGHLNGSVGATRIPQLAVTPSVGVVPSVVVAR